MANSNQLENISSEKKPAAENISLGQQHLDRAKTDSENMVDDKNGSNKEKNFKSSQRSMRRGSGAGSPNSQLSIPRCPAFDFSEQEDVQSLFPSPSEPEANRNIKAEILQGMQNSEAVADVDSSQSSLRLKDISQKKRDTSKSKTLMPELMENSETESAKGSFECEAPDIPQSVEAPQIPIPDIAFPSLPNTFLAKLGVHKDSPLPVEIFDEQELESKFVALSLAFKTDRTTLSKRLELHKRQRDMAEKNVENEFQSMRDHLNALNLKATNSEVRDLISKIQNHLDIAQQATSRVSGRSETYGAVQQEERVSRAFEVLVLHVDHLKRLFDKEHKELEETRRMLTDTRIFRKEGGDSVSDEQKKYLKTFGFPVGAIKSVGRRRASVADFHQHSLPESFRSPSLSQSWTSGFGSPKVEPKQRTLCPFPTASSVGLSSSSLPTSPVTSISPSRMRTAGISDRRCSLPAAGPMAPNMVQCPEVASDESTPLMQPSSSNFDKKLSGKIERSSWTRKLSSVTDEKEQSEEEIEPEKVSVPEKENGESHEVPSRDVRLLSFLKQVEGKINAPYENIDEQCDVEADAQEESDSNAQNSGNSYSVVLQNIRNSSVSEWLHIPSINQIWRRSSAWTLIRYFSSMLLIFFAILFLFSIFVPCGGCPQSALRNAWAHFLSIFIVREPRHPPV